MAQLSPSCPNLRVEPVIEEASWQMRARGLECDVPQSFSQLAWTAYPHALKIV